MSMAYVAVATAVISTSYEGYTDQQNNKYLEDQAQADANAVSAQGRVEAERIRKEKDRAQSKARAALAENGLSVNEGTSIVINDQIEQDGAYDANMAEIAGYNGSQRLKGEASVYGKNANTALVGGAIGAASSGANTYGNTKGWK